MSRSTFRHALRFLLAVGALVIGSSSAFADTKTLLITAPDGVTLSVQDAGNPTGLTVIFVHGLLGSHLDWDAQLNSPALQRYRLISYDLRGHGQSGKPTDPNAYSDGRRWADDLSAVIRSSHAQRLILVGWSLGGAVISSYLAAYGDGQIAGAVYVDAVIELKPEQLVPHPEVYRDMTSPDLKTHLDGERTFLGLCFHTQPDRPTFERLLANAAMASWDMQSAVQSLTVPAAEGLGKTQVPLLLIYGMHDVLVKPSVAIARATQLNPKVRSKVYANSGHSPFLEEPERFDRDLLAFIDETSRH